MRDCLVEYLTDRTRERFGALVEASYKHVYSIALRWVGDKSLARDVTQDVFLRLPSVRWKPGDVRSGLGLLTRFTISIARTLRRSRSRLRKRERPLDDLASSAAPSGVGLEDSMDLEAAVNALPEDLKRCVILRYYFDLETAEIANLLDIKPRTVQVRLVRACRWLRSRLAPSLAAIILPALGSIKLAPTVVAESLVRQLRALIARHPRKLVIAAKSPVPKPAAPARRRRFFWGAAALIFLGLLTPVLNLATRAWWGDEEKPHAVVRAPTAKRTVSGGSLGFARSWAAWRGFTERLVAMAEKIDWKAMPPEDDAPAAALDVHPDAVCEVRVLDENGKLVRSGTLEVTQPMDGTGVEGLSPDEDPMGQSLLDLLFAGDLAAANPARFLVAGDQADVPITLIVTADGYPPVEKSERLLRGPNTKIDVILESRRSVTLKVLNASTGEPWSGARMTIRPTLDDDGRTRDASPIRAKETGLGAYVARGLDEGKHDLSVTSAATVPIYLESVDLGTEMTVWVQPSETKRVGRIVATVFGLEGKPWPSAPVVVRVDGRNLSRTTDERGVCTFEELPEGVYEFNLPDYMKLSSAGCFAARTRLRVQPGQTMNVLLGHPPMTERLAVEVVGPNGEPRAGVVVEILGRPKFGGKTGPDGLAVFSPIPAGGYQGVLFGATSSAIWLLDREITVKPGEENRERFELGTATIRGRVVSSAHARIRVVAGRGDWLSDVNVGADGDFELTEAYPGKYTFFTMLDSRGSVYEREWAAEVPESGDPPEVELNFERLGVLWVEVANADVENHQEAQVRCFGSQGEVTLKNRSTGVRAREFCALVEPDVYRVEAVVPGYAGLERMVGVKAGGVERVKFPGVK